MRTEIIRSRIDPVIKQQANLIIHDMGLTMSDAIRLFLYQVIAEHKIPFEIKAPNESTLKALHAAEKGEVETITMGDLLNEWQHH